MNSPWCGLWIFWQLTAQRGITPPQTWRPVRSHFDHFCVSVGEHNDWAIKCQIIRLQVTPSYLDIFISVYFSCICVLRSNVCCCHALFGRFAACAHSLANLTHGKISASPLAECLQLSDSEPQFGPDVRTHQNRMLHRRVGHLWCHSSDQKHAVTVRIQQDEPRFLKIVGLFVCWMRLRSVLGRWTLSMYLNVTP